MRLGTLIAAAVAGLLFAAAPASADTASVPPGNPCVRNNGNPCNGNNGNLGEQGNAGHERTRIDRHPDPIMLSMPPVSGRGAYINQIGDSNVASIVQAAPNAFAKIDQDGDRNTADVAQKDSGNAYLEVGQTGDSNFARVQQTGVGSNVAYLTQDGSSNWAYVDQNAAGAVFNGARLSQTGNNNDMLLYQDGSDNRALLSQEGDGNGMTAVQLGVGNRLAWSQVGTNLTDLQITQTGGTTHDGQIAVTQTGTGN